MQKPKHIVLIPDGNRRWARKKGLPSFFGHREGAKTTEKILKVALGLKIPYFTLWGCSIDNLTKRTEKEVKNLINIFEIFFKKLANAKEIHKQGVKINILGRWKDLFPVKAKKSLEEAIKKTKDYKNYQLTFLIAYSGVDEMTAAIKKVAEIKKRKVKTKIDGDLIKANLWTKDLPVVDLIIRTSSASDPHLSNGMMMWDIADSQFYFTDTLYPDFSANEFKKVVERYSKTERRIGV